MTIQLKNRNVTYRVWCVRGPVEGGDWNDPNCKEPVTNVKRSITHHSPAGFEWGYQGSGPADLALQILHDILPPGCDGLPPVRLFRGQCSALAWMLHQDFKRDFIARLPRQGGEILPEQIDAWLDERLPALLDDSEVIDESDAPELR